MRARLPARCRSYLLNEAERSDNHLATRRSQSRARRGDRPRKTYEPAASERGSRRAPEGDDDKSDAAFNYEPISAPSSRCAPLERILLKRCPSPALLSSMRIGVIVSRISFARVSRLSAPRALLRRAPSLARPVVKKLSRASASGKNTRTSRLRLLIAEARDLPTRVPCPPLGRSARGAQKEVPWWIEPYVRYFHVRMLPPWTYIKANLCRFSIKRRRVWEVGGKTRVQGSAECKHRRSW